MSTKVPSKPIKRSSNRRSKLQCRLCLQVYPKPQLADIFGRGSDWQNHIQQATSVTVARTDPSTLLCAVCQAMISVIVSFQRICQRTDVLLSEGRSVNGASWKDVVEVIESLHTVVTRYEKEVLSESESLVVQTKAVPEGCNPMIEAELENPTEQRDSKPSDVEESDYGSSSPSSANDDPRNRARRRYQKLDRIKRAQKVVCDTCGKLVSNQSLEGHLNRHRGVKPFVCDIDGCGRQLFSRMGLHQHRHLHKSINRFYDCQDCGKRIKGTTSWHSHRKLHTEQPRHTCDVCGKKFRKPFILKMHSVVHTGVALYPCEICGKRLTVKHNLRAHYRMHAKKGEYPKGTVECQVEAHV